VVDRIRVTAISNECSGKTLTVTVKDAGGGILGNASSVIPNNGDNMNPTIIDFIPDFPRCQEAVTEASIDGKSVSVSYPQSIFH
jgi:hypothetical protein